ncbi:MAG: ATP-binding protein [Nibricoccus sp.]
MKVKNNVNASSGWPFATPAGGKKVSRGLCGGSEVAVVFLGADHRLLHFTPSAEPLLPTLFRDDSEDCVSGSLRDDVARIARSVSFTLKGWEDQITGADGRAYVRRIQPNANVDGYADGLVVSFVDITECKKMEEALRLNEQRHQIILDGIKEYAIFMLDLRGRIVTWTLAAERVLGYSADQVLGRRMSVIYAAKSDQTGVLESEMKRAMRGSVSEGHWYVRNDGHRFWGTGTLYAFKDNGRDVSGFIKVVRDNTDHKLAEEKMQATRRAARKEVEAKDCFLSNVSHELRTPLSAILLWTKLLSQQDGMSQQELQKGLQAIRRCAEEQQALVEDLLDMSRIAAGKMRLEMNVMELVPMLQSAVDSLRPVACANGLEIDEQYGEDIGAVNGDPHRLNQVVWNLLTNAAKFTPAGGRILVSAEREGSEILIKVTDSGKGISADFLPHVFDRFRQSADAEKNPRQGLGLGLYITRQLVELHGGSISAHSFGEGKGATFTVRLPAVSKSTEDAPETSNSAALEETDALEDLQRITDELGLQLAGAE